MIRVLSPAHWSPRMWVWVIVTVGLVGLAGGAL